MVEFCSIRFLYINRTPCLYALYSHTDEKKIPVENSTFFTFIWIHLSTSVYTTLKSENYECKYVPWKSLIFPVKIYFLAAVSRCLYIIYNNKKYMNTLCTKSISLHSTVKNTCFLFGGVKKLEPFYGNSWAHNIASLCATVFENAKKSFGGL